jgi:hypothetical protein
MIDHNAEMVSASPAEKKTCQVSVKKLWQNALDASWTLHNLNEDVDG